MKQTSEKDKLAIILCAYARDPSCDADKYVETLDKFERAVRREVFDYFDKYACIKNDKWYLELKEKMGQ